MNPAPAALIGVWDGHDAGAALLLDGRVALALNEERLSGRKLDVGLPVRAIAALRAAAGDRPIHWAVTTSDPAKTLTRLIPALKERYYRQRRRLAPPGPLHGLTHYAKYHLTQWPPCDPLRAWTRRHFARVLAADPATIHLVEHHEAHAASALFWPAWQRDVLAVTLDGIGDGESGSVWRWSPQTRTLKKLLGVGGAHSLGLFFEHVTHELQMRPLEDEGKVMALATFAAETPGKKNVFLPWFNLAPGPDGLPRLTCAIRPSAMARAVRDLVWCHPREQLCRMAQDVLETLVPAYFAALARATGCADFAYSGGVASNIKVNRLLRLTPGIDRLEICPAMGDGGLALGAAQAAWFRLTGQPPAPFTDFRLGPDHGDLGADAEALARPLAATCTRPADVPAAVADLVAAGEVVMWAQGRMELGARALGARSIVARADSIAARDDLNLRLKRRVWFQPFCPSLLAEEAPRLLADYRDARDLNQHMTTGFQTTPAGRAALAGAIGTDGSCRPQLVPPEAAGPWRSLLEGVRARTGTGAVINTSLNLHGAPMPDLPAGIVAAWHESGVRHLALGSAVLTKSSA